MCWLVLDSAASWGYECGNGVLTFQKIEYKHAYIQGGFTVSGTELQTIRRLRSRQAVDRLCELRALQALARAMTQQQIARELRVSQSAISQKLRQAQEMPTVLEGFTGGTLTEIMQQYVAEEISQDRLVDQLVRWPYRSEQYADGFDWNPAAKVEGTWEEVAEGLDNYLIDDVVYERVQAIRHEYTP